MVWDDTLTEEQKTAASHVGNHARLLAGPGTGKTITITHRICYLIEKESVSPADILCVTFTRAATHELRKRVERELGDENEKPKISTLHSFALRQLLRNSDLITALPQPLRIADDWEERNIILEDLKYMLGLDTIKNTKALFDELSADWQSLNAEEKNWNQKFPNPSFLGAWREHRTIYGYTLRSELVYQLKRAMERLDKFNIEGPPLHLLVDEYQDLNRCDLAVIKYIVEKGVELFVAGDDDQSIYGFRKAHPEGIKRFLDYYPDSRELELTLCKRCDPSILELGLFIASLDHNRLEKPIKTEEGRERGEVTILEFTTGVNEAMGIAKLCKYLIDVENLPPNEILILIRSDRNSVYSSLIRNKLAIEGVPAEIIKEQNAFVNHNGRYVLSLLRLIISEKDHLAWRTILEILQNSIGLSTIRAIYNLANKHNFGFADALFEIKSDPSLLSQPYGNRVKHEVEDILLILSQLSSSGVGDEELEDIDILDLIDQLLEAIDVSLEDKQDLSVECEKIADEAGSYSIFDFLSSIDSTSVDIEQELSKDKVNILTMHKAKGLTSEAAIVAAAEDEILPGRNEGSESIGDERRLLYVSLTRAKHYLFITYCNRRTGKQQYTGRNSSSRRLLTRSRRELTRFLHDAPISPENGEDYISDLY